MDPVVLCQLPLILLYGNISSSLLVCFTYLSVQCFFFGLLVGFELVSSPFELQFWGLPLFDFCRGSFSLAALLAVQVSYFVEVDS